MLDWLKTILGDAYTEDLDKKVAAEIGKNFVAKSDFNATNEAKKQLEASLKDRDMQFETLQKSNGDAAALREQITQLQAQNAEQAKNTPQQSNSLGSIAQSKPRLLVLRQKTLRLLRPFLNWTKLSWLRTER